MRQQGCAHGGQPHSLVVPFEQLGTQLPFQRTDLLAEGGWETKRRSAARVKCSSSATATK